MITSNSRQLLGGEDLRRLQEFYVEMQRQGLVRKREYDLPLVDTIGRELYHPQPTDSPKHT